MRDGPQFCFPRRPLTSPMSSDPRVYFNLSFLSSSLPTCCLKRRSLRTVSASHIHSDGEDTVMVSKCEFYLIPVLLGTFRTSHCWRINPFTGSKALAIFPYPVSLCFLPCSPTSFDISQASLPLGSWHPQLPPSSPPPPKPLLVILLVSISHLI